MKEYLSKNKFNAFVLSATFVMAGLALGTAFRLYQLKSIPVTPVAPGTSEAGSKDKKISCQTVIIPLAVATNTPVATTTPTPTATPTIVATATPTSTATPTPTVAATATPTAAPTSSPVTTSTSSPTPTSIANNTASVSTNTPAPTATSTAKSTTKSTAIPTSEPSLPVAGINLPTILAISISGLLILGSLILAL